MKILVTGGTGHVGSEVVKELQKRNADVRILIRKEETPAPAGVQVMVGDLLDRRLKSGVAIRKYTRPLACQRICGAGTNVGPAAEKFW